MLYFFSEKVTTGPNFSDGAIRARFYQLIKLSHTSLDGKSFCSRDRCLCVLSSRCVNKVFTILLIIIVTNVSVLSNTTYIVSWTFIMTIDVLLTTKDIVHIYHCYKLRPLHCSKLCELQSVCVLRWKHKHYQEASGVKIKPKTHKACR